MPTTVLRRPEVAQIGHDDSDDRGPAGYQGASRGVAPIVQLDDRLEYSLLGSGRTNDESLRTRDTVW